jgi:hypothetical protein
VSVRDWISWKRSSEIFVLDLRMYRCRADRFVGPRSDMAMSHQAATGFDNDRVGPRSDARGTPSMGLSGH